MNKLIFFIFIFNVFQLKSQQLIKNYSLMYLIKESKEKNPNLLILLHGLGSDEKDLFELAESFPNNFTIISVRAPYNWSNRGYSWYDLQFDKNNKPISNLQQAETSRIQIIKFIKEMEGQYSFNKNNIYLCGFSQGAIMSYSVALTRPDLVKGIAVMSGRLLDEIKPKTVKSAKLNSLKIFISHGIRDNVLNVSYAREARKYLKSLKLSPVYREYNEGHSISSEMLKELVEWLKN